MFVQFRIHGEFLVLRPHRQVFPEDHLLITSRQSTAHYVIGYDYRVQLNAFPM